MNKRFFKMWKYGFVLMFESEDEDGTRHTNEDRVELVELYDSDDYPGEFLSFCQPRIRSLGALEQALDDCKRDGINRWFYDNGEFTFRNDGWVDWEPNEEIKKIWNKLKKAQ